VVLKIPETFCHRRLEIIILPLDEQKSSVWLPDFFEKFIGCLPDFPDIETS